MEDDFFWQSIHGYPSPILIRRGDPVSQVNKVGLSIRSKDCEDKKRYKAPAFGGFLLLSTSCLRVGFRMTAQYQQLFNGDT